MQDPSDAGHLRGPRFTVLDVSGLHRGPDGGFLTRCTNAKGGEGILVGDIESLSELDEDWHGLVGGDGMQRGRDIATHREVGVRR